MADQQRTMEVDLGAGLNIKAPALQIPGEPDMAFIPFETVKPILIQRMEDVKTMQLRPDDILLTSYPRSGTHWLFEIVSMMAKQKAELQRLSMGYDCIVDRIDDSKMRELIDRPSPRVIVSHFLLRHFSDQIAKVKPRIVYALRNPKDAMVSMYRMQSSVIDGIGGSFDGSWTDYFKVCGTRGGMFYGGWFYHVLEMEKFMRQNPSCPVNVVVYEELRQNPTAVLSKLAHDLGESDHIVPDIVKSSALASMRESPTIKMTKVFFKENADGVVSRGEIGRWRETFTVSQSQEMERIFKEKMADSKLAQMVRPYTLACRSGSEE